MSGRIEGTAIDVVCITDAHRGILIQLDADGATLHAGPFRDERAAEYWLGGFTAACQWATDQPEVFIRAVLSRVGDDVREKLRAGAAELVDRLLDRMGGRDG